MPLSHLSVSIVIEFQILFISDASAILCAVLLGTASAAFHPGMSSTSTDSEYAEYEQNLYCDALRCIGADGLPLKMGSIVRADVCGSFCLCAGQKVVRFDCPANLYFNEAKGQCDHPQVAQCVPEFLSKEALDLYVHFNPDKMYRQRYDVKQLRRLWQCVDTFKNNKTMPHEIPFTEAEPAPGMRKAKEMSGTDPSALKSLIRPESKKSTEESNIQKSSSPQSKSNSKSPTESKLQPGKTISVHSLTMDSPNLNSSNTEASQKQTGHDRKWFDNSSTAEFQEAKVPQNCTSDEEVQLNFKRESDSTGNKLVNGTSNQKNNRKADSSKVTMSLTSNDAKKPQATNSSLEKESEESENLNNSSTIDVKAREDSSNLSTSNIGVADDSQISRSMDSSTPIKNKSKNNYDKISEREKPSVDGSRKKVLNSSPAVVKSRFAIVQKNGINRTATVQDNFFATVVKMARKIKSTSRENNILNKTRSFTNADNNQVNVTSDQHYQAQILKAQVETRPDPKDSKEKIKGSKYWEETISNVPKKNLEVKILKEELKEKENLTRQGENACNLTAPARLPQLKTQKNPGKDSQLRSEATYLLPKDIHPQNKHLASENAENAKEKVSTVALLKLSKLPEPEPDVSQKNPTANNPMKDLKPNQNASKNTSEDIDNDSFESGNISAPAKLPSSNHESPQDLPSSGRKEQTRKTMPPVADERSNESVYATNSSASIENETKGVFVEVRRESADNSSTEEDVSILKTNLKAESQMIINANEGKPNTKDTKVPRQLSLEAPDDTTSHSLENASPLGAKETEDAKQLMQPPVAHLEHNRERTAEVKAECPSKVAATKKSSNQSDEASKKVPMPLQENKTDDLHTTQDPTFGATDVNSSGPIEAKPDVKNILTLSDVFPAAQRKNYLEKPDSLQFDSKESKVLKTPEETTMEPNENTSLDNPLEPEIQYSKVKESNAVTEEKIVAAKVLNADKKLPAEEFDNTEEEQNSSTGELLMKLRKALQDVYEKAARSNLQRTNHEHLTFKKRVRLLRHKRKSRDTARRGALLRSRRQFSNSRPAVKARCRLT